MISERTIFRFKSGMPSTTCDPGIIRELHSSAHFEKALLNFGSSDAYKTTGKVEPGTGVDPMPMSPFIHSINRMGYGKTIDEVYMHSFVAIL
jgi:hypothetical protein